MKKILALLLIPIGLGLIGTGVYFSYNKNNDIDNKNDKVDEEKQEEVSKKTESEDILYEDELYKVTFNKFEYEEEYFTISFYIENKTDTDMNAETHDETINSSMMVDAFNEDLPSKEKTEFTMVYNNTVLEKNNIKTFEDIKEVSFELAIWNTDREDLERYIDIKLYPHEDRGYDFINYQATEKDNILLDNEDYTIISTGFELYNNRVIYINLYGINKTDKDIVIQLKDPNIGQTTPYHKQILPNKELIESFSWWKDEEYIKKVENISFKVCILDKENYSEIYCTPDDIVLEVNFEN